MPANAKPPNEEPTWQEFAALRLYLAQHRPPGVEAGDWSDEITNIIGDDVNERTRSEITNDLILWMSAFLKAP